MGASGRAHASAEWLGRERCQSDFAPRHAACAEFRSGMRPALLVAMRHFAGHGAFPPEARRKPGSKP